MTVDQEQPEAATRREAPAVDTILWPSAELVLAWLPGIAAFACGVMLFARALVPATHGWLVGVSRLIDVADFVAATVSYALALVFVISLAALLLLLLRGRAPASLRVGGVFLAVTTQFALLTTLTVTRLPSIVHLVMAAAACLAGLMFGADATRRGGLVGLVPATVGLASALRTVGAYNADRALSERHDLTTMNAAFHNAQMLTTVASGFLVVAVLVALLVMFQVDRRRTVLGFALALGLSVLVAWQVQKPVDDADGPGAVLLRRFGQELMTRPPALFDGAFAALLALFVPLVGLVALAVSARKQPVIAGAIALCLLAGASAEIPLLALGLIVGSLALAIDRRDPSGGGSGARSR